MDKAMYDIRGYPPCDLFPYNASLRKGRKKGRKSTIKILRFEEESEVPKAMNPQKICIKNDIIIKCSTFKNKGKNQKVLRGKKQCTWKREPLCNISF